MDLRAQTDECLILRSRDFNESDRLLTVFGRHLGKLACLARGVRKPKSRLKAATLPFVCGQLEFSASPRRGSQSGQGGSQGLRLITQGETLHSLPEMREDLVKIGMANYVAEMLDWVLPPEKPQENLYILAMTVLLLAAAVEEPRQQYLLLKFFEVRLLGELGWRPRLEGCARCGRSVASLPPPLPGAAPSLYTAPALGGLVCATCRRDLGWSLGMGNGREVNNSSGEAISKGGVRVLIGLLEWEPRRFLQLRLGAELSREINRALWSYLDYHLGQGSQKARKNLLLYCSEILTSPA